MKIKIILCLVALLSVVFVPSSAKAQQLPERYSITVGGGMSIPDVYQNDGTFYWNHKHRLGLSALGEFRYSISEYLSIGAQYHHISSKSGADRMHVNYAGPALMGRAVLDSGNGAIFASVGCGYFGYSERSYGLDGTQRYGTRFKKDYFGACISFGYEMGLSDGLALQFRGDVLTADWFINSEHTYHYDYYDGYDHGDNLFDNNITFFNLGIALTFGK